LNLKLKIKGLVALLGLVAVCSAVGLITIAGAEEGILNYDNVEWYVMDNGMRIITKSVPSPLVAIQVWVETGSINEGDLMGSGVSHFVEHMLFKGTKQRKVGQIAREIRQLGGVLNAYTSLEQTVYHLILPAKYLEKGLEVMADAIQNSSFDPEEFKREQKVILKEINMGDVDRDRYLHKLFCATMYTRHPYRHPVIGYRQVFESLNRQDLLNYYQQRYVPHQMVLVLVGGIDQNTIKPLVQKYWGDFNRRLPALAVIPDEPLQLQPKRIEQELPSGITRLLLGFQTVDISDEDLFPLDVLAIILGKGRSSRLYRRLKEEAGIVYEINSYSYTPRYRGYFAINADMDYEKLPQVEESIWQELNKIKQGEISAAELDKAKNQVISELLLEQETVEGQAKDLGLSELLTGDYRFSTFYLAGIKRVSLQQLTDVAQRYFKQEKQVLAVLKPKTKEISESKAIRKTVPEPKIKKEVLGNGLTLLIRENHQLPLVTIDAAIKGGVHAEQAANNGVFNFIQHMLLKGSNRLSGEQIAQKLESVGGQIAIESGANTSLFTITMQQKDFELGLRLLADIMMNPAFPANELENVRAKIIADIKAREDELFYLARNLFMRTIFEKSPYRFPVLGDEKSVAALTREALIRQHREFYVPGNMVLSIFGDVNTDNVSERVDQVWGGFESRGLPVLDIAQEKAVTEIKSAKLATDKKQCILLLGYPGIDILHQDRYAFQVMTYVLSGQGSRVFDNLREKQGLAYYAGAFMFSGIETGAYIFYVGTTQDKLKAAKEGLLTEIKKLRNELITEDELNLAKQNIIGSRFISRQQNQSYSVEAVLDELLGLGYQEVYRFEQGISEITREDIKRIALEYFNPEAYVEAIAGDLPK
jgi:zinc protease